MPRSKGKAQKGSIKLGASIQVHKDARGERAAQTLDFKTAAAMPEFTATDVLANAAGKRVATNTGMKTAFAAESSLNITRRINNASIPLGCAVEDDAAVAEEVSIDKFELSQRARQLMPRRPTWSFDLSSGRLHHREVTGFKSWMASVQELIQERGGYPPAYETNIQVWRQLWRVLERCHVAVVVLDARHPLLHLPPALVYHVSRTLRKPLVVVLNKLDAVDPQNAALWAKALKTAVPGISGIVGHSKEPLREADFSPLELGREALIEICHKVYEEWLVTKAQEETAKPEAEVIKTLPPLDLQTGETFRASASFQGAQPGWCFKLGDEGLGYYLDKPGQTASKPAPKSERPGDQEPHGDVDDGIFIPTGSIMLGMVGHPNVGKSSMVNSLFGNKVVSVKATPGHTKTLQTLNLDDRTCLCDSPGVVFPRLEVPREAQIVGMLVPLAQVREPFSAIRWVMERSTRPLNELLGLKPVALKRVWELQELGIESLRLDLIEAEAAEDLVPWSPTLLCAQLATQRGFLQGGRPDVMKAGTEILERVLQGRVPYSVEAPRDLKSAPVLAEDEGSGSDWQMDDEDYESEEEEAPVGDRDLLELFGEEARGPGRGSKSSQKRFKRRQKMAEIAGEADPARVIRPYAGRLEEVQPGSGYPG
mmetsp:Transcript_90061/g.160375  ORF Transcript_90061/g.160375 Transcript_90061/m.160375 type:complete len:652 (+) Transcript_90061:115-2070(+)|eukprot:CAMPEP_0197634620 /NCGR_PEP_ID=MMETSP1338-20131121/10660_1 /TAXON_ID=43686 ORGANISM="Pelagodinium beii, Strain RCC1491" /NCGR_SAMPLE_ID=MMETSP1338 /ASSEMBLY_ACC=CAM_ASM_000754 /LENGTH=651 /DNA_ID=CAMNT_0043206511 /DNA_START=110 /DNA_END=2065 /DNA_ORIENTATION=-